LLKNEPDHLVQANFKVIFFACVLSLALLLPLQVLYHLKTEIEWDQVRVGWLSVSFYLSGLFVLKHRKTINGVAHILVAFSTVIFTYNLWLYPSYSLLSGLHMAVNLVFAINLLQQRWQIVFILMHIAALSGFWYSSDTEIEFSFIQPIVQSTFEKSISSIIILVILVMLIYHYKISHILASKTLKKSLIDLQEAKKAAEEMNQLKSRFLANMSHEIRTPLNGVLGINEILKETTTDAEVREYLEIQHKSGHRLLNTIDGILNLSRLEVNKEYFKLQIIDIVQVIKEVVDNQKVIAEMQNVRLIQNIMTDFAIANVDETITYQAISNIINNAIKFTNSGGTVEIRLEKLPTRTILLSVIDTGIGISPDYLNRIFEPFERETTHHTAKHTGTGLGLSITQKFVELMGGNIAVESELGKGTTFKMSLPCAESTQIK
jgi:signal transduction histidine kinase